MATRTSLGTWKYSAWRLFAIAVIALSGCESTGHRSGHRSGWFRPLQHPPGKQCAFWSIGLSGRLFEARGRTQARPDGTHVHAIRCSRPEGDVFIWDRISDQYNGPAVASLDPNFRQYANLDSDNQAFLENTYNQLRLLWRDGKTTAEFELLQKLRLAISEYTDD